MKPAIIKQEDGKLVLDTPFDRAFVDVLKEAVPYQSRDWTGKVWLILEDSYHAPAVALVHTHFTNVVDTRLGDDPDEAILNAEIVEMQIDQAYILDNQAWIQEAIAALDTAISRYSYRSKSAVKGRMAHDRALLAHAITNAQIPIDRLTELQVRGLAAARRLIETETINTLITR